jgi:putative DNA primase/helicase
VTDFDADWVGDQFPDAQPAEDAPEGEVFPPPSDPLAVARHLIEVDQLHDPDGVLVVRWWRGSFYLWVGTHWNEIADPAIRARTYHVLEHAQYWKVDKEGDKELVAWAPTRRKVGDVLEALQAVAHLAERLDPPAFVEGDGDADLLALANGLLHLRTRRLEPHTPRLFNLLSLPYDFDLVAPEPERWLAFLTDLWLDDPDSIDLLQEWFGYVLSGDTRLHKILLLIGPVRSGKGTIARVLTALVGKANTAGPTLASLGTNFGLSPLLGKALAVVSDARLGGPNTYTVVERLLSISGEDTITVDRKYKEPWTGRLGARFVVISNELPDLGDASGAIATRFAALILRRSWLGMEDHGLTDDLLEELPGILRWSLKGLDRLREQGHFTEPASSRDAVTALTDVASPTGAFVRDRCEIGPTYEEAVDELYAAWRAWCETNGRDRPGTVQTFGRNLRAVVPSVRMTQPRTDEDQRERRYIGIKLSGTHNGSDRVPPRSSSADEGPARDGTQSDPLWSAHRSRRTWQCPKCGHQTITVANDMTALPCLNRAGGCTGRYEETKP